MRRFLFAMIFSLTFEAAASGEKLYCEDPKVAKRGSRAPSSVTKPNGIQVLQVDPNQPMESLESSGYEVLNQELRNAADPWGDPSPVLRDYLFRESGAEQLVKEWDHLQKDMLFLRAQEYPLKRLKKKYYPKIPEGVLQKLQSRIALAKRSGVGQKKGAE